MCVLEGVSVYTHNYMKKFPTDPLGGVPRWGTGERDMQIVVTLEAFAREYFKVYREMLMKLKDSRKE